MERGTAGQPGTSVHLFTRTNLPHPNQAGRYQQQLASSETHPYWQYLAILDGNTRKSHAAMHGRCSALDDPIWDYFIRQTTGDAVVASGH
ncbi:phage minor head protein [Erwinia tracheiphila]|uniref:phage minor head protein n=1 Tax=Erwinia tracheiphila TaxID=65700 RepID=UPI00398AAA80